MDAARLVFNKTAKGNRSNMSEKEKVLDLGVWLGRHHAFGMMTNRCSAADAECLRRIQETGAYRELDVTWEQFCKRYAGISRATAERIIARLEEFGDNYFHLSQIMRLSPESYRAIAGNVEETFIEYGGEKIPILKQNAVRIAEVVETLRRERDPEVTKTRGGVRRGRRQRSVETPMVERLSSALGKLETALARVEALYREAGAAERATVRPSVELISLRVSTIAA